MNTLGVMDFANEKYVWKDGVHYENPMLYEPEAPNDFYLTPSGLHIRACYWVLGKGSIYDTYGISLMYSYLNLYNDKGYIPTVPKSGWIYGEYGVEGNFYDTRFNTDTVSSFMHMQEKYPDIEIEEALRRYFSFFASHVKNNSYYVDEQLFVADYMNHSGKSTSVPHCSLNHMLEEMAVMFRYATMYENKEIFALAEQFLQSITATKDKWIRPNGDLFYCVTVDGEYIKQDYPLVIYNDLRRGEYTLRQIYGEAPADYMAILDSKTKWARGQGLIQ